MKLDYNYHMRVFSEIHNSSPPSEIIPRSMPLTQNNLQQNRINQARESRGQHSILKNNPNKQGFKLQPEQFFEINKKVYIQFNDLPPHIRVENQSQPQQKEASKMKNQQMKPRRIKIFNELDPVKILLNGVKLQQAKQQPAGQRYLSRKRERIFQNQVPEPTHMKLIKSTQVSQYQNSLNATYTNQHYIKIKRENDEYEKGKASKILVEPILKIQSMPINQNNKLNPQLQSIINGYPNVIERLQANENDIALLKNKVNQKNDSNIQQQRSYYISPESNQPLGIIQKIAIVDQIENKNISKSRKDSKYKTQLQIQREKRLQNLIQQNKYLSSKVLQQRHRIRNQNQSYEQIQIQNIISPLERVRRGQNYRIMSANNRSLNNLNISAIPDIYQNNSREIERSIRLNPLKNQASLYHNKTVQNLYPQKQPQNIMVRRFVVPISKIY